METRSAFVAIVGCPNVGKSSLLNAMLGEKVAIVSDKPQTTRTRITGVLTKEETQLVFVDTPGMHQAKNKLSEHMLKAVADSVGDVDLAVLVTEPLGEIRPAERALIERFVERKLPAVLVLNKIDLLEQKERLIEKIDRMRSLYDFSAVIPLSARTGDGVDLLLDELCRHALPSPHYFPDDTLTDQPERVIVAEIIREKLLWHLNQEVPHGIAVSVEQMKEREGSELIDIDAVIYCERESHKGIIIGKRGSMLKAVASEARVDIERFLSAKVNLQCWVKVKEDWRNREGLIRSLGLDS